MVLSAWDEWHRAQRPAMAANFAPERFATRSPGFQNGDHRLDSKGPKAVGKSGKTKSDQSESEGMSAYYCDPSSAEQVIESHLRRQRHTEKILREMTKEKGLGRQAERRQLGLTDTELTCIRQEALNYFFDSASLSEELRQKRVRNRERFESRRLGDNDQSTTAAVLFARHCEVAIKKAVGEFSDMLTQTVIARRGRKDMPLKLRRQMWEECLSFAMELTRFETVGVWIDKAWGTDPRESPLPHLCRLGSNSDQQASLAAWSAEFRTRFEDVVRHGSSSWLNEADRKMDLRCLLTSAPRRAMSPDKCKQALALLLTGNRNLTTEQLCVKSDGYNEQVPERVPIPASWQRQGARSWIGAYERFPGRVKTYVSSVRRAMGLV